VLGLLGLAADGTGQIELPWPRWLWRRTRADDGALVTLAGRVLSLGHNPELRGLHDRLFSRTMSASGVRRLALIEQATRPR
jgi:hypothetical protein